MKNKLQYFLLLIAMIYGHSTILGQDFVRIGATHDFIKNKIVQTFSFDFNRTEIIDEKKGKFLIFDTNHIYLLPTCDVNLGDGVTSSENNVLFQLNFGKAFYGNKIKSNDNLRTSFWNKAIELNPSYNSDKLFSEKLTYAQAKLLLNYITQKFNGSSDSLYINKIHSIAFALFSNLGYRYSATYNKGELYSTLGLLTDCKTRLLKSNHQENWIFKITGNYYYIASDVNDLTSDNFGGIIKCSIDKLIIKNVFIGTSYKYGNDNPNYKYVHTLELSAKFKY
jgi:hypothetical protein